VPAQRLEAARTLEVAVREKTSAARAAFLDAVPPAPRVSADDPDRLQRLADEFQAATATYLGELEALLATAAHSRAARSDSHPFEQLAAAAARTRAEATAIAQDKTQGALAVLSSLGAHGLPVALDAGLGRDYERACTRILSALVELGRDHGCTVVGWTRETLSTFAGHTQALTATIEPDIDAFTLRQTHLRDQLEAAAATVQREADKLGR
jgi:hypothetical protein